MPPLDVLIDGPKGYQVRGRVVVRKHEELRCVDINRDEVREIEDDVFLGT